MIAVVTPLDRVVTHRASQTFERIAGTLRLLAGDIADRAAAGENDLDTWTNVLSWLADLALVEAQNVASAKAIGTAE